ncbi:four-carbon acid sugar kinase family protein [Vibrio splendidus]|uniref:3-oxo-tetronate kinase n=1 Tax=Vibrio splendidus TaxID=29497 RepID=UPI0024691A12|nr:3-oxo-tetronate kinase [Vibrio splendidus]MDH5912591.1 four-carbon acid sugar kinase family protein [Vibrio splendidus]MDH5940078.1 four-carbon acid sugar kinase family protein [Vibrio splendidus]MDH5984156.1 four-carbon acid sugar kinase family protein [Vibrio splendidus]MDH5992103.1 four-carbon acid sugar kinase family protein [Vibrio splendidus]MDH6004913.1 four-carbon acid sugar kinase family protein [Vibrio splendidus]
MLLGVIADDFTGATDIAGFLVENGMRTIQLNGIPTGDFDAAADAVVISLKSRSCPVGEAITDSVTALKWLQSQGCQQFYFKYCSTFDSTAEGNIGPVTDALLAELGESFTMVCPALPVNGRTVYNGHLFVFGELLSDSGMRNHPVTPMTDSSVVRMMDAQSEGVSGLVNFQTIEQGSDSVTARFEELKSQGNRYAVVDAFNSEHLVTLGQAAKSLKLITGGSGLAAGIAKNWTEHLVDQSDAKLAGSPVKAPTVVFSGSCSVMTNQQVAAYKQLAPHFSIDVKACLSNGQYANEVFDWVMTNSQGDFAPLVYATADAAELKAIQEEYGAQASSDAVEQFFSQLAIKLQQHGVKNFIVAGGETSGVVTQSLAVKGFHIGPQIAPGVPWVKSVEGELSLALKSGNFGDESFFAKAQSFFS